MSALVLKLIAMATMLVDHTACALHVAGILSYGTLYTILRGIGRLAFPIFGFQLVQGAIHTRSKWKYLLRLAILAVLSEVPFDLTIFGTGMTIYAQNVFFTLFLGLLAVYGIMYGSRMRNKLIGWGFAVFSVIVCTAAAELLHTDYGDAGVLMISAMGLAAADLPRIREIVTEKQIRLATFTLGVLMVTWLSSTSEALAFLDLIFIYEYNGQKGYSSKLLQYGCYLYYPAHLLILGILFVIPQITP